MMNESSLVQDRDVRSMAFQEAAAGSGARRIRILRFLLEDVGRLIREAGEIAESLFDGDLLYKIKKHVAHFENHARLEESFFREISGLPLTEEQRELIQKCRRGNRDIGGLLALLVESLSMDQRHHVQKILASLERFERAHFLRKTQEYFPMILESLDAGALNFLHQNIADADPRLYEPVELY